MFIVYIYILYHSNLIDMSVYISLTFIFSCILNKTNKKIKVIVSQYISYFKFDGALNMFQDGPYPNYIKPIIIIEKVWDISYTRYKF